MAASLMNLVQWSTTSYSTHEFLDNYEPRFPTLALVRSIGAPPKAAHNLTNTETIFVGQVLKINSATEGQKRLILEVDPGGLLLNIPIDCPAKFDIPNLKKRNLKLKKILSSSKYTLPLLAETSSKYSAYFEKAGAKITGDVKKRSVKMIFKKVREKERFFKTNFIHEGTESPLVTFISADLPIELAIVESYIGPGTEERLRNMYQLTPSKTKAKANGQRKKRTADDQLVIGAGLYIMIETSANNNYIINQNSPGGVAASTAGVYIEDDVDGAEFDDIRAEQDIALNSGRNSIVNATTSAVEEQEQREERDEGQMEENEEEENLPQRNRALSASFPEISDGIPSQRVDGEKNSPAVAAATERRHERELVIKEDDANMKQESVSQAMGSKQFSLPSVQVNPGQSKTEDSRQNPISADLSGQLAERGVGVEVQGRVVSPDGGAERQMNEKMRSRSETGTTGMSRKSNSFDDVSLESDESGKNLNSSGRIDDTHMQRKKIAQVTPVTQEQLNRPTPMPRQSLRSKASIAQQLITEMKLGSTGVFCVELLPLVSPLDSDHRNRFTGRPLPNQDSISDDEHETSNERSSEINSTLMHSPARKTNLFSKSVSSSDSFSVTPRSAPGRAQLENVFFFDERLISPSPRTKTRYAVGISSDDRNAKGIAEADRADLFKTSTEREHPHPNMFSWSNAPLNQAYSLDRRQTHRAKAVRLGSQNTDDASTQTMFNPNIDRRTIDEDSMIPSRSVDRPQSKTVVQMSDRYHLTNATSDVDDILGGRKVHRNDSIIKRIILNDSDQATCKITSFTSTPSNDRSTAANISYRIPSFRTEPVPVPSISTLPRKWPTSTPVQATRTASSSSAHRHVVTVELPPYFEAANVSSFSPDSAARNRMADSGRYVDQWNTSRSTPDLAARPDASSRYQAVAAHTSYEALRPDASLPRGTQQTGYTIRINTHEDRQNRARQNKRQEGFQRTANRTEMETVDENARLSPITNANFAVTPRQEVDYRSRKTIGRSRTTVSDDPRTLNQTRHRGHSEEAFLDEEEVVAPGNTGRPVERLRCTTRTRSLDNPIGDQRTEDLNHQSKVRKEVIPERVKRNSGLVVTTSGRVRQLNENERLSTTEHNRHVSTSVRSSEVGLLQHPNSNRIHPERRYDNNLSNQTQVSHAHRNIRALEEFDYHDSSIQSPNHQPRRINYKMDEAENRGIDSEQFQQSHRRVRTSKTVIRPNYDIRKPEEFRRSNILDSTSVPVQNLMGRFQMVDKQNWTADREYQDTRKHNDTQQTKNNLADIKQTRNTGRFVIRVPETELTFAGNTRSSARNDDIKMTSNENERGAEMKSRSQPIRYHRDRPSVKANAAASATPGYNQNKHQSHSYSTAKENILQPSNSIEYLDSTAPVATVNGVHAQSSQDLKVSASFSHSRSTLDIVPQLSPSQMTSNDIGQVHQTKKSKRRRNKEIAADQELTYPIDMTVRETIRALDSFLKEQDPDAQSVASSQFTEHRELMIHHDPAGTSNF